MIAVIFNHKNNNNAKYLKGIFSRDMEVVVLDSGSRDVPDDFIRLDNIYYSGLFNQAAERIPDDEWVFIITSDIHIDEENYQKMMTRVKDMNGIGCYSPSLTHYSKCHHFLKNSGSGLKDVKFCEGFFVLLRSEIIKRIAPVDVSINKYGWGLDVLTGFYCHQIGLRCVIDNDVIISHPSSTGYEVYDASRQMYEYFDTIKNPDFKIFTKGIV